MRNTSFWGTSKIDVVLEMDDDKVTAEIISVVFPKAIVIPRPGRDASSPIYADLSAIDAAVALMVDKIKEAGGRVTNSAQARVRSLVRTAAGEWALRSTEDKTYAEGDFYVESLRIEAYRTLTAASVTVAAYRPTQVGAKLPSFNEGGEVANFFTGNSGWGIYGPRGGKKREEFRCDFVGFPKADWYMYPELHHL